MKCPFCHHDETKVIDSRGAQDDSIRRRRECLECHRRFTTYEKIEEAPLRVIKRDGTREAYDREKIRAGIEKACSKRPVTQPQIEQLIVDIENELYDLQERDIPSSKIGDMVLDALKMLDPVAAVRFSSVYNAFQDPSDFMQEVEPLLRENSTPTSH